MTRAPLLLTLVLGCAAIATAASKWSYDYSASNGPMNWGSVPGYALCGNGMTQSPINLMMSSSVYRTYTWPLAFSGNTGSVELAFRNDGHAIVALPKSTDATILSGGPLGNATYRVYNIHIHFGNSTLLSSEHALDAARTNGEFHIVTYNTIYSNLGAAVASGKADALAVFGVLFNAQDGAADAGITSFLDFGNNLTYNGDSANYVMDFSTMYRTSDLASIYTYEGSLTTPGCQQVVTWLVTSRIHTVTPETLDALSSLRAGVNSTSPGALLLYNTRPLQALNGRTVARTFSPPGTVMPTTSGSPVSAAFNVCFLIASVVAVMISH